MSNVEYGNPYNPSPIMAALNAALKKAYLDAGRELEMNGDNTKGPVPLAVHKHWAVETAMHAGQMQQIREGYPTEPGTFPRESDDQRLWALLDKLASAGYIEREYVQIIDVQPKQSEYQ